MNPILLATGLGFVAGLRTMTAPAAVSWAAHLGWLQLDGTPLAFMDSGITVTIFTTLALVEYVVDLLPTTPNRTQPGPLFGRFVTGALSGAALTLSAHASLVVGVLAGGIGAFIGAFAGYETRRCLVQGLQVKDAFIALPEDLVAIALAGLIVAGQG
jgi:uncharacterized membrane protein